MNTTAAVIQLYHVPMFIDRFTWIGRGTHEWAPCTRVLRVSIVCSRSLGSNAHTLQLVPNVLSTTPTRLIIIRIDLYSLHDFVGITLWTHTNRIYIGVYICAVLPVYSRIRTIKRTGLAVQKSVPYSYIFHSSVASLDQSAARCDWVIVSKRSNAIVEIGLIEIGL